jgi:hypothetical protein
MWNDCEQTYDEDRVRQSSQVEEVKAFIKERWPFVTELFSSFSADFDFYLQAPGLTKCAGWSSKDPNHVTLWGRADLKVWENLRDELTNVG